MNRSHSFVESTQTPAVKFSDVPPDIVQPVQVVRSQARAMAGTGPAANNQVLFSEVPPDVTQPVQIVATARAMSAPSSPVPDLATTIAELRATGVADEEIRKFLKEIGSSHAFALGASSGAIKVTLPGGHILKPWQGQLLLAAIAAGTPATGGLMLFPFLNLLPAIADRYNVCIGIGPAISAAIPGPGLSLGDGILFAPGNRVGFYGSAGGSIGLGAGISLTMQVTIVHGGPEVFGGTGFAVSKGGGEGVVGEVSALFDQEWKYVGVSFAIGIGSELKASLIDSYAQKQFTVTSLGQGY